MHQQFALAPRCSEYSLVGEQEILLLSCRAVPPSRKNRDGMVTPLNADSTSTETPKE